MKNKNICIVSLYGNFNYGNKLQVFAIQEICSKLGYNVEILKNSNDKSSNSIIKKIKKIIRILIPKTVYRNYNFKKFEKKIKVTRRYYYWNDNNNFLEKKYDYFIVGSDQVWNPNFGLKGDLCFLEFVKSKPKISFAASFGIDEIPKNLLNVYVSGLNKLDYISVREVKGKEIIEKLKISKKVDVLVDPTMLLTAEEWDNVCEKPKMLKSEKFILNYFLGDLNEERKKEIYRIAKENNCEIINILDKSNPFYECGPSEFLYLEKYAFLICTDSFHASVFAIIFNRPFIIFDRESQSLQTMGSRLNTLIDKFKLKNRRFNGVITKENLNHDYTEAYKILEKEREKADKFLKKALNYNQKKR